MLVLNVVTYLQCVDLSCFLSLFIVNVSSTSVVSKHTCICINIVLRAGRSATIRLRSIRPHIKVSLFRIVRLRL